MADKKSGTQPSSMKKSLPKSYLKTVVLVSAIIFTSGALITSVGFYFALTKQGASYASSYALLTELNQRLVNIAFIVFFLNLLLSLAAIIIFTIIYSHRIAGPLYRLGIQAHRIRSGDLEGKVKLRETDVLHVMADDLNDLSGRYRDLVVQLETKTRDLGAIIDESEGRDDSDHRPGLFRRMSERIDELKGLLSQIKL